MARSRWLPGTILLALVLAGCASPAVKQNLRDTQVLRTTTTQIVASNTARLAGKVKGPDAASLISKAKFRLEATLGGIAGASVEVLDEDGKPISYAPVTTDGTGAFTFTKLRASEPVVYLKVTFKVGDGMADMRAIAVAPRSTAQNGVVVDPGSTLVTKKTLALLHAKALNSGGVDARTAGKVAAAVTPELTADEAANAVLHDDDQGARDFDAVLKAHADLARAIDKLVGTSALSHLLDPSDGTGNVNTDGRGGLVTAKPLANTTGDADGVTRIAGGPAAGYQDGAATAAAFDTPYDVCTGPDGTLYVADSNNNAIRQIDPKGNVTTLAGGTGASFADGPGKSARLNGASGVTVGPDGALYVADYGNNRIRRIDLSSPDHTVSTIAGTGQPDFKDGPGATARFSSPADLTVDAQGHLYVADTDNHRIRMIDLNDPAHAVSTLAGSGTQGFVNGPAPDAQFSGPQDVAVDTRGDVYTADTGNHAIRRINMQDPNHAVTTLAGNGSAGYLDGNGTNARLDTPYGLAFGPGGVLYVADAYNNSVRMIAPTGDVTTFWGGTSPDPSKPQGLFNQPSGVAIRRNSAGVVEVFIADAGTNSIRKFAPSESTAAAGSGEFNAK